MLIRAKATPRRVGEIHDDRAFGWRKLCGAGVELRSTQCDHRSMLEAPHVADLARIVADAIRREDDPPAADMQSKPKGP